MLQDAIDSPDTQKTLLRLIIESPMPEKLEEFKNKRAKTNLELVNNNNSEDNVCHITPYNNKQVIKQIQNKPKIDPLIQLGESTHPYSGSTTAGIPTRYNLLPTNNTSTIVNKQTPSFPDTNEPIRGNLDSLMSRDDEPVDFKLPMGAKGIRISNLGLKSINSSKRGYDGVGTSVISSISIKKSNDLNFGNQGKNVFAKRKTFISKQITPPNKLSNIKSFLRKGPKLSLQVDDDDDDDNADAS